MKSRQIFLPMMLVFFIFSMINTPSIAQTSGTLTFSVTTAEPPGGYSGVHVIALWIEDTNGNFIKTKIRYAQNRVQYLDRWIASSASNVVDATTGATLSSHGTLTFNWNATNTSGSVVPDKYYKVWIQMSDRNQSGTLVSVTFAKDIGPQHITPANSGYFTDMVLDWNPVIGVNEIEREKLAFHCEPNPFKDKTTIHYSLPRNADVTITLHDATGNTLTVLSDMEQLAGEHTLYFESGRTSQLKPGIYYLSINTGFAAATQKLILTR
jgi:hypothetical protein